jgi:hypothetical protein
VIDLIRARLTAAALLLALSLFLRPSVAPGQKAPAPRTSNSREWFNEDAVHHPNSLLLKFLQFTAPYPGFYQKLTLDGNGNAFTARIVPDWAIQGSVGAKLDGILLDQIKQKLSHLNLAPDPPQLEPREGQLHTAFIFCDGIAYGRYDFNGPLPAQVQEILDRLMTEIEREAKHHYEEFLKHHEQMEQLYGDWQNRSGVAVISGSRMHGLKGIRGLLLTITGQRKQALTAGTTEVSIYHALIFYPEGVLTGSGSNGSWSDDPLSTEVVIWDAAKGNGSGEAKTDKKVLEIKHQAIDNTVSVGGGTYQLDAGNMFIIRMSNDWKPVVSQIKVFQDEQIQEQSVLDGFKSILRDDEFIKRLELN